MSVKAITWAIEQDVRPASAKLLLIVLANYANDKYYCWPSKATIAADCSMSKSTVCEYLTNLQKAGLISVERRFDEDFEARHRPSLLTLHVNKGVVRQADNGSPGDGQRLSERADKGLSDCADTNHKLEPSFEPPVSNDTAEGADLFKTKPAHSLQPQSPKKKLNPHRKKLFDEILPRLAGATGRSVSRMRTLMGKWSAQCRDDERLLEICTTALEIEVFNPVDWIFGALKNHDEMTIRINPAKAPPMPDISTLTPEQKQRWERGSYVRIGVWSYHRALPPSYVGQPVSGGPP
jgi:hypothetical protein